MPRFFTAQIENTIITLTGEDAHHLTKVLRARPGDSIQVCDGQGTDYLCTLESLSPSAVVARVDESRPNRSELPVEVTLYQALCKGDKLELIVQKAVELGVTRIVPVITARCVSLPDPKSLEKKRERWQKIAQGAAEQSGRGIIPQVGAALSFAAAVEAMAAGGRAVLFYERATRPLGQLLGEAGALSFMTGPEGGFEEGEVQAAQAAGLAICTLGSRILRCETAPLAAMAVIAAVYELL